jgi:hypothetical protein
MAREFIRNYAVFRGGNHITCIRQRHTHRDVFIVIGRHKTAAWEVDNGRFQVIIARDQQRHPELPDRHAIFDLRINHVAE